MKRFLTSVLAAILATSIYVLTASGGSEAVTPKQFKALKAEVIKLQKEVEGLKTVAAFTVNCFTRKNAPPFSQEFGTVPPWAGPYAAVDGIDGGFLFKRKDGKVVLMPALMSVSVMANAGYPDFFKRENMPYLVFTNSDCADKIKDPSNLPSFKAFGRDSH